MRLGDVSGVATVANGEVERAGAGNGDDGCSALRWLLAGEEGGRGEAKMERGATRADAGVMKARPGASWPARTECWRRAAVAGDTRRQCSVPVGHCTFAIQLIQTSSAMSDSVFSNRFNC